MRRLVVQSNLEGRRSRPSRRPRPIDTGHLGGPGGALVPLLDRLPSHTHLCWAPWKLSLVDLARRPPSYVPQSCAPLSNSPIRRLCEAALSPRSAKAGSDAFPCSILSARSIRPLCGRLVWDCHAGAPRLALYIHTALVRFAFRAPISPTYQPNLAARSRGLLDVGAFGGPCKAGRAWLVLESEACHTSPSI